MLLSIPLSGLRVWPLASYLAGLGVLRLLNEQLDPAAAGCWREGRFHLASSLTAAELEGFFLHRYAPTPMVSPWNGDGGFFSDGPEEPRLELAASSSPRLQRYRETLAVIAAVMERLGLNAPPTGAAKERFVRTLHGELPAEGRRWVEAVFDLSKPGLAPHSLFFTGGNDGRFEVARNAMIRLAMLLDERKLERSREILRATLWDETTRSLVPLTSGYLEPFSTGGLSSSSLGDARQLGGNPWTYLLGLEGSLLLSGTPLLGERWAAGQPSLLRDEEQPLDLMLPFWSEPLRAEQVRAGLCDGTLSHHLRYARAQRNGRAHFAFPTSVVPKRASVLDEPMRWLRGRGLADVRLEGAALGYLQTRDSCYLRTFLEVVGGLGCADFPTLYYAIVGLADDGSAEFALARAVAGMKPNLGEHFYGCDLTERLRTLMRHQLRTGRPRGRRRRASALRSLNPAPAGAIRAFLRGEVDEPRLERLLRGIALFDPVPSAAAGEPAGLLPLPYRLAKMAYHPMGDTRTPARSIEEAFYRGDLDEAVGAAVRFLQPRHPRLPLTWPGLAGAFCDPRRMAAALLFPISDELYREFLTSVNGADQ